MKRTQAARTTRLTWAWLLCLAFMLPLAQLAAAGHELSHLGTSGSGTPQKGTAHADACALCVATAAVGSAAPGSATNFALLAPAAAPLRAHPELGVRVPGWRYFASRAPPSHS